MQNPSLFAHLRDILILPVTMTIIVPILIKERGGESWIPPKLILTIIGAILLFAGICLLFYTIALFRLVGKGTLAPWSPTQRLVVTGPYRYCRNPMITGVLCILIGESLVFHSGNLLIWAGIFFLINTTYFLLREEPDLQKRFGDDYVLYKKNVPRWIPRLTPWNLPS